MYINDPQKIVELTGFYPVEGSKINRIYPLNNRLTEFFDEVDLSDEAKNLLESDYGENEGRLLEFVKKNVPDVRKLKVEGVKSKLLNGDYDRPNVIENLVDHLMN